jgi:hypothetical protein
MLDKFIWRGKMNFIGDRDLLSKMFVKAMRRWSRWSKKYPVKGDHIRVSRTFYYHHGIYVSDNEVIHYNTEGEGDGLSGGARVLCTALDDFLDGGTCEVRNYSSYEKKLRFPAGMIVKRAKGKLGKRGYNLVFNNCEHFTNWCALGVHRSEQVEDVFDILNDVVLR